MPACSALLSGMPGSLRGRWAKLEDEAIARGTFFRMTAAGATLLEETVGKAAMGWRGALRAIEASRWLKRTAARYREMMNTYADMPMMAVWYSRLSYDSIRKQFKRNPKLQRFVVEDIERAQNSTTSERQTCSCTGCGGER